MSRKFKRDGMIREKEKSRKGAVEATHDTTMTKTRHGMVNPLAHRGLLIVGCGAFGPIASFVSTYAMLLPISPPFRLDITTANVLLSPISTICINISIILISNILIDTNEIHDSREIS